jgi:hypothetical protein
MAEPKSFAVIESERCIKGVATVQHRCYISSLPADAPRLLRPVRARTGHAAHNLAVLKHITLNLIRLPTVQRKGSIRSKRLIAASPDSYRAKLLGMGE